MKTILIPTDYQASAFNCIPSVVSQLQSEEINLVFVHMFKLSDSVTDLMMLSRRSREYEKVSDEFYQRCNEAKAQYPQITNIKIEFLYGSTLSMFKDFLEHNEVDAVVETAAGSFNPIHKSSINPAVLVQKCGLPVISVNKTYERVMQTEPVATMYQREEFLAEV
jgi:hypothetical protein